MQSSCHGTRTADELMREIIYHVGMKSIRISEFLRDFDLLKTGTLARSDFIRALNHMGFAFAPEEYEILANQYRDPEKPDRCRWRQLELDVEQANGTYRELEKYPTFVATPQKVESPTVQNFTLSMTENEFEQLQEALDWITVHLQRHSMSIKELFHDFDKLSSGRVTQSQLRQVLSSVDIHMPDPIFELICRRWTDKEHDAKRLDSFCYLPFVKQVERPFEKEEEGAAGSAQLHPIPPKVQKHTMNINQILFRLKTKVKTERIRVYDFLQDFDPLRSGYITENEFIRGVDTYHFGLQPDEARILAQQYTTPGRGVDYRRFSDDMEAVFTIKQIERFPTYTPKPFQPTWHEHLTQQTTDLDSKWLKLMRRLTEEARQRRMFMLLRYLEDHDKIHNGTISKPQFCSSLSAAGYCLDEDEAAVLFAKYGLEDNEDQIDYLSFNEDFTEMIHSASKDATHLEGSKVRADLREGGPLIS